MIKEENKPPINRNKLICNYPYFASKDEDGRIVAVFIMVAGILKNANDVVYFVVSDDGTFRTHTFSKDSTFDEYFAEEENIYAIEDSEHIKFTEIICDLS